MGSTLRLIYRALGPVACAGCALATARSRAADGTSVVGLQQVSHGARHDRRPAPALLRTVAAPPTPSAVVVDAPTRRVFVFGSTANDSRVGVLDAATGRPLRTTDLGRQTFVPTSGGGPVAVADPRTGQVFVPVSRGPYATGLPSGPGTVLVLDGRTGAVRHVIPVGYAPQAVGIDARTQRVFVCNGVRADAYGAAVGDYTLGVLDAGSGAVVRTVPHLGCAGLAVDEQTGRAFALGSDVLVLDAATGAVRSRVSLNPPGSQDAQGATDIAVDERAGRVLVGLSDSLGLTDGRLLDATTGRIVARAPDLGGPMAVDEGAGRAVAVGIPTSSTGGPIDVATVATRTGRTIRVVTVGRSTAGGAAVAVAADPRTHRAFVVAQVPPSAAPTPDVLTVLDTRTGLPLRALTLGTGPPAVAVDEQTGRAFVANAGDNTVSVLDTARL